MLRFYLRCLLGSCCLLAVSGPANAQYAFASVVGSIASIGDGSRVCDDVNLTFKEETTERIRGQSENSLKAYLALAGGGAAVDVRPIFTTKKRDLHWSHDGQAGDVGAVDDPIARSLAASRGSIDMRLKGDQFVIGVWKSSAAGIWRVVAADDPTKVVGSYRAVFWRHNTRDGQTWDLASLDLINGPAEPAKLTPFCMEPGDREEYLAAVEKEKAERARKSAESEAKASAQR